ncbi:MAG TPA: response regulator transcription factor [Ramlibacter sp.]|nr:response regulator transcription factor [Ramlibacter sp.]
MRILLVEDDKLLADALCRALAQNAYAVDVVGTGNEADAALAHDTYDLAILDIGLPGLSGLDVLQRLRGRRSRVPVLMLTAMDALADRVRGLDLGADDYLAKPFDLPELEARVRALLRRGSDNSPNLVHGRLRLDTAARRVYHDNQPVDFSAREFAVLELLLMREGRVVSKEHMVNHLYGWGDEVGANAIEVYVHRIRKKLEPLGCEIRTVRGMGYLMEQGRPPSGPVDRADERR